MSPQPPPPALLGNARLPQKELVEFVFRRCKLTDKGDIEPGELDRLTRSLHLSNNTFWPVFAPHLAEIIRAQDAGDAVIDLDYFLRMHHKHPMILYPALHTQV